MGKLRNLLARNARSLAVVGGLAAIVALETPVHEGIHCAAAATIGPGCEGVKLNASTNWYMAPLSAVTPGLELTDLPPGTDGLTQFSEPPETALQYIGSAATSALPELLYTTAGMGLLALGVSNWRRRPFIGLAEVLTGYACMDSTLGYMRASLLGAKPTHDYFNVTQDLLQVAHLPGDLAYVFTPLVGVPLMLGVSYVAAGALTQQIIKRREAKTGYPK